jgi:hypothetical protein
LTSLSSRALNRATLARRLLLERSPMCALDAIEYLVGIRVQPYVRLHDDEVLGEITAEGNRLLDIAFAVVDPVVEVAS